MSQYTDMLSQRSQTWAYGTEKKVVVIHLDDKKRFIICADEKKQGFVLIGTDSDDAKENETGVITFTEGGPLGGYWKFKRDAA